VVARPRAWRSAASSASARSTSWVLRSRLTAPENLVIPHLPVQCSSGTARAWPRCHWVGSISTRDFSPFSTRSRSAGDLAAVGAMIIRYRGGSRFTTDDEIARITVTLRDPRVRDDA